MRRTTTFSRNGGMQVQREGTSASDGLDDDVSAPPSPILSRRGRRSTTTASPRGWTPSPIGNASNAGRNSEEQIFFRRLGREFTSPVTAKWNNVSPCYLPRRPRKSFVHRPRMAPVLRPRRRFVHRNTKPKATRFANVIDGEEVDIITVRFNVPLMWAEMDDDSIKMHCDILAVRTCGATVLVDENLELENNDALRDYLHSSWRAVRRVVIEYNLKDYVTNHATIRDIAWSFKAWQPLWTGYALGLEVRSYGSTIADFAPTETIFCIASMYALQQGYAMSFARDEEGAWGDENEWSIMKFTWMR